MCAEELLNTKICLDVMFDTKNMEGVCEYVREDVSNEVLDTSILTVQMLKAGEDPIASDLRQVIHGSARNWDTIGGDGLPYSWISHSLIPLYEGIAF